MIDLTGLWFDSEEMSIPDQHSLDWMHDRGVSPAAMSSPLAIHIARVIFDGERYHPNLLGDFVYAMPIIVDNEIIDIAAWSPSTGEVGTRLGIGSCLGENLIGLDGAGTTGLPLQIWRAPLGWLLAERTGLVVVDEGLAAHRLSGVNLRAEDAAHASVLHNTLRVAPPVIIVPNARAEAAA